MGCGCGGKKSPGLEYVVQIRGTTEIKTFEDKASARIHAVSVGKGATVVARKKTKV